jgi:hypothetical protein
MASAGGTILDEPPLPTRRERRQGTRPGRGGDAGTDDVGGPGSRKARRKRADRRRLVTMLLVVAGLLALTVAVGEVIRSDSGDGASAKRASAGGDPAPGARTMLLAHRGADGRLDTLILAGVRKGGASVLLLPVATQVEVPSLGPQSLADLPNEGDTELLTTTIENLLGVKVADTVVMDDAALNAALAPAGPLSVQLSREVQFEGSAAGTIAAGTQQVDTGQAARLLVSSQPGSELDRLVTVQDVMDAWFARLRDPAVARETLQAEPDLAPLVAAAKIRDRRTDTLPVESITVGGAEGFRPRGADVVDYVVAAFPDALLAPKGDRPRVEVLNGTGAVGIAQTIASQIVPAGAQVTLAGNVPNFGLKETQVVYYRGDDRDRAQQLLRALGCGSLKQADTEIGVVDVTILAGADCFPIGDAPPAP